MTLVDTPPTIDDATPPDRSLELDRFGEAEGVEDDPEHEVFWPDERPDRNFFSSSWTL